MRPKAVLVALGAVLAIAWSAAPATAAPCGLPDSKPLWIDYAEGSRALPQRDLRQARRNRGDQRHRDAAGAAGPGRADRLLADEHPQHRRSAPGAGRPILDRGPGERTLRSRGRFVSVRDALDRARRAVGRESADAVVGDQRSVPRQHSRTWWRRSDRPRSSSRSSSFTVGPRSAAGPGSGGGHCRSPRTSSTRRTTTRPRCTPSGC